jgi:hypothetical protein
MWERRGAYRVLVGKHKGKNHFKNLNVDGAIILKWMLTRLGGCGLDSSGLGTSGRLL